jgi:hypothetical protein
MCIFYEYTAKKTRNLLWLVVHIATAEHEEVNMYYSIHNMSPSCIFHKAFILKYLQNNTFGSFTWEWKFVSGSDEHLL